MLYKDITKAPAGTFFAVAKPNSYMSKTSIRNKNVPARYISKAVVVNPDRIYASTSFVGNDPNSPNFRVAPATERTKRVMVSDGTNFWVASSTEFISLYSEMEVLMKEELLTAEREQARMAKLQAIKMDAELLAKDRKEILERSIRESLIAIFGELYGQVPSLHIGIDGDWSEDFKQWQDYTIPDSELGQLPTYTPRIRGTVDIPVEQFMQLVEKLNELQEA